MPLIQSSDLPLQVLLRRLGALNDEEESMPAFDDYRQHLEAQPQRESFAPSNMERILYGVAGAGVGRKDPMAGYKASRELIDRPFEEAKEDWMLGAKGKGELANLERLQSQNRRMNRKSNYDIANILEDNRRAAGEAESRDKARKRQGDINEERAKNYGRNIEDQIANRGARLGLEKARVGQGERRTQVAEKGLTMRRDTKSQMTEKQLHDVAVQNVLRENPEWADLVDKGVPREGLNAQERTKLINFNVFIEREKERLRKGLSSGQLPPVNLPLEDEDDDGESVFVGDEESEYEYIER